MTISATNFVYDNLTTEEFGVIICSFNGTEDESSGGSKIEFTKPSVPINKKWLKLGQAQYQEPLEIKVQICKNDFSEFDSYDKAAIARWLVQQDNYKELRFSNCDYEDVMFMAMVNEIEYIGAGKTIGISINFICDAPFGYGHKMKYDIDTSVDGNEFTLIDLGDEIGYIYPDIHITFNNDCNFELYNSIEDRKFTISNCKENEEIHVLGEFLQMETNVESHMIYNDSNLIFPRVANFYNNRKNNFRVTGDCKLSLEYRPIRKVGV